MLQRIGTSLAVVAVCGLIGFACASQGTVKRTQHNVVTADELARAGNVSLYDALRNVRPIFLRSRGPGVAGTQAAPPVQVYVGALEMAGVEHLSEIMARNVAEVRYLSAREANARFGSNHGGGALLITMMK